MALVLNDRVKETSVTTGTVTLTLDGAVQGFETFSSAIGNSNTTFYAIELPGTTEFEVGRGTVSAGQLARTEIISSSNSDSAVDFSAGTKIVFCTLPASKFVPGKFEGANFADSILIGHSTTGTLSSAEDNTGVGIVALDALTSGDQNTAVGNEAGSGITSSGKNTGVGAFALNVVTDSTGFNSAFGRSALQLATGSYNTGVGAGAGENITSGSGNVIIGKVLADSATGDRQLKISGHDGSTTTTWISGDSAGALTFADKVVLAANKTIEFGDSGETISGDGTDLTITSSNDLDLVSNGTGTQSTLITSAGGIYLDSAETNRIDAATGILNFYKAGTLGISLNIDGNNDTVLHSRHNDKDIKFDGQDNNSTITALTLDMSEAGAATFNSTVTANAGLKADNITIDGTEIDLSSGDLTIDVAGDISLDADGGNVYFKDAGASILSFNNVSQDVVLKSEVNDKDFIIQGVDNGSAITALTLDMSAAGSAIFNNNIIIAQDAGADTAKILLGAAATNGTSGDLEVYHDGNHSHIRDNSTGDLRLRSTKIVLASDSMSYLEATNSGSVDIYHNSSKKFETTSAGATVTGALTADGGLKADNITIDGTEIDLSSGDLTLDVAGDIILNADGGDWMFRDDTTEILKIFNNSSNVNIKTQVQDKDLSFLGNDGGSGITALTLDMSEAGAATFNDKIILGANKSIEFGDSGETITGDGTNLTIASSSQTIVDSTGNIQLKVGSASGALELDIGGTSIAKFENSSNTVQLRAIVQDKDIEFRGNDGGSQITALSLDMSEAGAATFNDEIILGGNKKIKFGTADENINGDGSNVLNINSGGAINIAGNSANITSASTNIANFSSGGSKLFVITNSSQSVILETDVSDKDLIFKGNDGGSVITALTLDMSEAGAAAFNSTITADSGKDVILGKNQGTNFTSSLLVGHNTTGTLNAAENNTGVGIGALDALTTGDSNVAFGTNAGSAVTTGALNVFIGTSAGVGATDMQGCIAIGAAALGSADPGNNNIAIGESAGANITGVRNLCIGENAGDNITSGSGNVIIGSAVDPASATGNRQLIIAGNDGSTTTTFITGDSSGNITIPGTVTANGEVLTAGVSAGFAVAMAIAL